MSLSFRQEWYVQRTHEIGSFKVCGMEALSGLDIVVVDAPATQLGCLTGPSAHQEATQHAGACLLLLTRSTCKLE